MAKYAAFVSYRREPTDTACAEWLVEALETFVTPDEMVREGIARQVGAVFRDDDELAASADLSHAITQALYASSNLIVVCSRQTPHSLWVRAEIALFQHWGRGDCIFAVLTDVPPQACYPPELQTWRITGDGAETTRELVEPAGASVLPVQNQTEVEARELARDRILCHLLGCDLATLRNRDERRRRVGGPAPNTFTTSCAATACRKALGPCRHPRWLAAGTATRSNRATVACSESSE